MRLHSILFYIFRITKLPSPCLLAVSALVTTSNAQNTSYNLNSVPVNGNNNSAFGYRALYSNTSGINNVGIGYEALYSNTTSHGSAAFGAYALRTNTTGSDNTATGYSALRENTTGNSNTASGFNALRANTTGSDNAAFGSRALSANTTGWSNVAVGRDALYSNTIGAYNTAGGNGALYSTTDGNRNTGFGFQALRDNSNDHNTAIGFRSLVNNTSGSSNTGCGTGTLLTNKTGTNNTAIGTWADVAVDKLSNATSIGYTAFVNASNKVRIGNASVTVIEGQVPFNSVSDGRFKTNIKEEDVKGLEFIKKLRPVVYNLDARKFTEFLTKNMSEEARSAYLKQDFSKATAMRQSGFIAQEVEKAARDVNYDFNGVSVPESENDNYGLAYSQFVVPLVKAVQEQQQMIEAQKQQIETLQQQVNQLLKNQGTTTGTEPTSLIGSSMEQNVPNPFTSETVIGFNLPQQVHNAYMAIYDLSGKELKTLPIIQRRASSIIVTSDQLAAGMYVYSIVADGKMLSSKRMIVADK